MGTFSWHTLACDEHRSFAAGLPGTLGQKPPVHDRSRHRNPLIVGAALLILLSFAQTLDAQSRFAQLSDGEFLDFLRNQRSASFFVVEPGQTPRLEEKCGFGISMEAARRLPTMSPDMADQLRSLMSPVALQVSIVSPSGKFRIHFDTVGTHTPAMLDGNLNRIPNTARIYADSTAQIFDEVYRKQVEELGYDAPPFLTGDSEYQIYIYEYNGSYYGQTKFSNPLPNTGTAMSLFASYMEIDNDFRNYETTGLDGLRVTAAHEFHHMVQLGSYGLWLNDRWWHEMTSTYFEEVCYPWLNDYVQYVRTYAKHTDRPWPQWGIDGYELVLWPLFLDFRYGPSVYQEAWENSRATEPITSMRDAIRDHKPVGGDMASDVCNWVATNYYTGYRAALKQPPVYSDAAMLPVMQSASSVELVAEAANLTGVLLPLGAHYLQVYRGIDTLSFSVTNSDIASAISRTAAGVAYDLEVRRSGYNEDYTKLSNGWAYKFSAATANALCVSLLEGGTAAIVERTAPFPNPFNPREFSRMQFPMPRDITVNRADLFIYSVSMDRMLGKQGVAIELDDETGAFVGWDGRGDDGDFLPSGVYIYVINYQGGTIKGKFAVVVK